MTWKNEKVLKSRGFSEKRSESKNAGRTSNLATMEMLETCKESDCAFRSKSFSILMSVEGTNHIILPVARNVARIVRLSDLVVSLSNAGMHHSRGALVDDARQ